MNNKISLVTKGGLLHDDGKICQRATREREKHSVLGKNFLAQFLSDTSSDKQLLRCIAYHHHAELSHADLQNDDLAYVVYEADNIAAGLDRRENQDSTDTEFGFDANACLENIFNVFAKQGKSSYFPLKPFDADKIYHYPNSLSKSATAGQYNSIMQYLSENFKEKSPLEMEDNELLRILEDTTAYVPSTTKISEYRDISLFDHLKLTGAIAGAMIKYFDANGVTNYKKSCLLSNKEYREKEMFLMISGDFSGIQKFIYQIQSKGAMRMLRGRSFYLDMVLENIVDDILEEIQLSRANLIYCSGGHFYILADNTDETRQMIKKVSDKVNRDLTDMFSGSLYLGMGCISLCANDLMGASSQEKRKNIFKDINKKVS